VIGGLRSPRASDNIPGRSNIMRIGVLRETTPRERRVALLPDGIGTLVKAGVEVVVEAGAGATAGASDEAYAQAGATIAADARGACIGAAAVVKVQPPTVEEAGRLDPGTLLVSLLPTSEQQDLLRILAERRVTALALERVPRISRAQSMDVLSSQATLAGYKGVLLGASSLPRILPMLTTAAGNIRPAKAFVLGAGVAGLQAIATAKRLGAIVSAFDVRAAAREQVQSLGATFVAAELASDAAQDKGGYAKAQSEDEQQRTQALLDAHLKEMDLVVSTAAIPGRRAPLLITEEMVGHMKPGSVIVDLAGETGGNCALTKPGETVEANGVLILGPLNLASTVPVHASQMLNRNVLTLLQYLLHDGVLTIDLDDEITGAMAVTHAGEVRVSG
jgi:proton-translocating NAD(P)+ transhydrogenase subunit alpha